MIYTKDHVMQSPIADMGIACSTYINVFDIHAKDITSTKLSEGTMLACPNVNRTVAFLTDTRLEREGFLAEIKVNGN